MPAGPWGGSPAVPDPHCSIRVEAAADSANADAAFACEGHSHLLHSNLARAAASSGQPPGQGCRNNLYVQRRQRPHLHRQSLQLLQPLCCSESGAVGHIATLALLQASHVGLPQGLLWCVVRLCLSVCLLPAASVCEQVCDPNNGGPVREVRDSCRQKSLLLWG